MDASSSEIYTLSLHDALPILLQMSRSLNLTIVVAIGCVLVGCAEQSVVQKPLAAVEAANSHLGRMPNVRTTAYTRIRSEEHTSELQSRFDLVCRLLLEKKKKQ